MDIDLPEFVILVAVIATAILLFTWRRGRGQTHP
jgi:hypothetical protein